MRLEDVKRWLEENGVLERYYVFNGLGTGEAHGLGFVNGAWCTYYSERGTYGDIRAFPNEEAACRAFADSIRDTLNSALGLQIPPIGSWLGRP